MEELSKTEAGKKKVDKVRRKEEEYLVAYQDREEKRKAGEQQGDGSKKQKSAEKEFEEMDQILSGAGGIGQGGRDEPAAVDLQKHRQFLMMLVKLPELEVESWTLRAMAMMSKFQWTSECCIV